MATLFIIPRLFAITCSFAVLLLPGTASFGQEMGDRVHVTAQDHAVAEGADVKSEYQIPRGTLLRIEESGPNRFIVRYQGKPVYVNSHDVMTPQEALDYINQLIDSSPSADEYGFKVHVLYTLRRFEEAIETSNLALDLDPNHVTSLLYRGSASYFIDDFDETERIVEKCLEVAPEHHLTHALDFYIKGYSGNWAEAIQSIEKSLDINPHSAALWCNRGMALMNIDRTEEATESFKKATEVEPSHPGAWHLIGYFAYDRGDKMTASAYLQKAAELNCEVYSCYWTLASLADENEESEEYRKWVVRAVNCKDCPDDARNRFAFGMASSSDPDRRDGETALMVATRLIEAGETEPELVASYLRTRSAALAELGRFSEALESLDLINPDSRDSLWREMKELFENEEKLYLPVAEDPFRY